MRDDKVYLTEDLCVIDDKWFFVKGSIEIPVIDHQSPFVWGVWVCLSQAHFKQYQALADVRQSEQYGPYPGLLSTDIQMYPNTENLNVRLHIRHGKRPSIEVEPNGHPLAVDQGRGITMARVTEIYTCLVHNNCPVIESWEGE
jgi:hypothetical protein